MEIIPAILAEDFESLKKGLNRYVNVTSSVQIDVCDGVFVPTVSWPMGINDVDKVMAMITNEEGLPYWDKLDFEFDLMVKNGHEQFDFFVNLGAKRIVFHLEAEDNLEEFREFLEENIRNQLKELNQPIN